MINDKKKTGGTYEGEGSYACTFSPAPPCSTKESVTGKSQRKPKNNIAKIFVDQQSMDEEWKNAQRISEVDPKQRFSIYATSKCNVSIKEVMKDPTAYRCGLFQHIKRRSLPMLKMKYGGVALDEYVEYHPIPYEKLVGILLPVIDGMRILAKHKVVHNDLKFNNILYNDADDTTRIIDFGLMLRAEDVFDAKKNKHISNQYWLHPPEYRLYTQMKNIPFTKEQARHLFEEELRILDIYFSEARPTAMKEYILQNIYNYCDYQTEYIRYVNLLSKKASPLEYMQEYAHKIDTYSFGITLIHLALFTTHSRSNTEKILHDVIGGLIHPNPSKRWSFRKLKTTLAASIA